jgi:redox-sensitive bicupin YhaK (pirin superfamily)
MGMRKLQTIIESVSASDGAGVKLRRSLGGARNLRIDPFLMLDEFYSDDPDDYLAGFPSHPHRGSKLSPTCWTGTCGTRTASAIVATSVRATCSG